MPFGDDPVLLWSLREHERRVRCLRHCTKAGFELRVLWGDELFLIETFHEPAPLLARADEFRTTLVASGWQHVPTEEAPVPPPGGGVAGDALLGRDERHEPAGDRRVRPDRPGSARAGGRPVVLIVDDDTNVRVFLRRCLEQAEYAVCEASDVESALGALDETRVDAVVLDVRMPDPMGWGRTGLEVLAFIRLHSAFAALPVLIITGHALDPKDQDIIRRHRAHLFLKPDGYRDLLLRLDQLTDPRQPAIH